MSDGRFGVKGPALFNQGWSVLPAKGKAVKIKDWESLRIDGATVEGWATNGAGRLNTSIRTGPQNCGTQIVLIDVDSYDAALTKAIVASFRKTFGIEPMLRIGMAPKVGLLVRLDRPSSKINSPTWSAPDHTKEKPRSCKVEVLAAGQQFVAFGLHPDTGEPYKWQSNGNPLEIEPWELPAVKLAELEKWVFETVPTLIPEEWVKKGRSRESHRDLNPDLTDEELEDFGTKRALGRTIPEMRETLSRLPEHWVEEHDDWINVGQAIHHETGGSQEGLELWDEWSSGGSSYEVGTCETRWASFKSNRADSVTWRSMEFSAKKPELQSVKTSFETLESLREALPALQSQILQLIPSDRCAALNALQRDYSRLLGSRVTMSALREELNRALASDEEEDVGDMPEWAARHVWVHDENSYRNKKSKTKISAGGLDVEFGSRRSDLRFENSAGGVYYLKPHPAMQRWGVTTCDTSVYDPTEKDDVFKDPVTHRNYFNLYDKRTRQVPADDWTPEGKRIKAAIERHLEILIPNKRYRALFLSWWAFPYQFPGEKIMWSPVLVGCHGDGKNTLVEVFGHAIGQANINLVSGTTVATSPFSGYIGMHQIVFIDEIYHPGDRHMVSEKLKGMIGSRTSELHMKGKDPRKIKNVSNLFFASNHKDCVAIQKTERRYFVLFSPINTPDELAAELADRGVSRRQHFEDLIELSKAHPDQVALFLGEIELDPAFDQFSEAPRTEHREEMVKFGLAEEETGLSSLLLDEDVLGVSGSVVSVDHMLDALNISESQRHRRSRTLKSVLNEAGFVEWRGGNNVLKWQSRSTRVWVKPEFKTASPDAVRALLDKTSRDPFDNEEEPF